MGNLAKKILKHDIKAASKLIRLVEDELSEANRELQELYRHTGNSHIIGITGLPGSGKSTIINNLLQSFRRQNKSIGVIAIDPSSPFSGGSILGDRIRLMDHSMDEEILVKSIATRGWKGGVSKTTIGIINVMDALGKDIILIETAGVGQTEIDIMNLSHTTIVVLVPEMGDYIQTMKAGILEIANILVINKSDKDKQNVLAQNLNVMVDLEKKLNNSKWKTPVISTEATTTKGMKELFESIQKHIDFFRDTKFSEYLFRRAIYEIEVEINSIIRDIYSIKIKNSEAMNVVIKSLILKKTSPRDAALKILKEHNLNSYLNKI